jgi:hypothetical protein
MRLLYKNQENRSKEWKGNRSRAGCRKEQVGIVRGVFVGAAQKLLVFGKVPAGATPGCDFISAVTQCEDARAKWWVQRGSVNCSL